MNYLPEFLAGIECINGQIAIVASGGYTSQTIRILFGNARVEHLHTHLGELPIEVSDVEVNTGQYRSIQVNTGQYRSIQVNQPGA